MDDIDLHFPHAGVDVSEPVGRQPNRPAVNGQYSRTTPSAQNVRAYDFAGRFRGGRRRGLEKFVSTRPGGVRYCCQDLNKLVITGDDPVQPSQSGRKVMLTDVSAGTVYFNRAGEDTWNTPTNNTWETPALNATGLARSAPNTQKLFYVDGTNYAYLDGDLETVEAWVATDGDLPVDSDLNTARLICLWRGRTVLSGLLLDPAAIFMSKVSKPFDWDYAPPTPVPLDSAWSGQTGPQGLMGDVVTALIPYTDDLLIVGMDSSIAVFRGDPMAGGSIDLATTSIGIAWGEAWCMDPKGTIYFFSNRTGVFAYIPGQKPVRISQAIDNLLREVDTGEYGIRLLWSDEEYGFYVFITLLAEPFTTTHYFYEAVSNAWWPVTFVDPDMNPLCCVVFDGNEQDDRVAIVAGFDGYVRRFSADAEQDDGEDIESEVWIGPFLTALGDDVTLREIQATLGKDSGDVDFEVFIGETAEEALESTAVASGTFSELRNDTESVMCAGHAAYIKLSTVNWWALESIRSLVDTRGKTRQRSKQ